MDPNFFSAIPGELYGAAAIVAAAAITAAAAIVGHNVGAQRAKKSDAGSLALQIANTLQARIDTLEARVVLLEHDRNAYRSWSHQLWDHIHNENKPRIPAPIWPENLPR